MADYKRISRKFALRGISLARPYDRMPEGFYPYARNLRSYTEDVIEPRPGIALIADVDSGATDSIHSFKRLNDSIANDYLRIVGAGTKLYSGKTSFTNIATGLSGKPLSILTHRPDASPKPWGYIADANKNVKTRVGLTTTYPQGVVAPTIPATAALSSGNQKIIDAMEAVGAWTNGGTAGAIALVAAKRVNTTIAQIVYDSGTSGWACVNPTALTAQLQPGMLLVINTGGGTAETVYVSDVFQAITSTTIQSVQYVSGSTGECTIQLTAASPDLMRNSMLRIAAAENVRVLSVTEGPNGITSFRCVTTGARAAGDAVAGLASFRSYLSNTHAAAETLTAEAFESTIATGIGYLNLVSAQDLSLVNSRPVRDDDEILLSVRVDNPANVTEIKLQFDVDGATHDFTLNWYEHASRAADLTPVAQNTSATLTVQQRIIQRTQVQSIFTQKGRLLGLDDPGDIERLVEDNEPDPVQLEPGNSAWTTLRIKVSEFTRFGSDTSRGWANVAALRISANVTGSTVLQVDSLLIRGTYGLGAPGRKFNWIYRYESTETGVKSNPSPPLREMVVAERDAVVLTPTVSSDGQVNQIRWFRFSELLDDYYEVGVQPNSGTFTDEYSDEIVVNNPRCDFNKFQPWIKLDVPRTGTCDVKGTEVTRKTGDTFNTSWGADKLGIIKINGVPYSLYTQPSSTSRLSLNENAGTQTDVTWTLEQPYLLGQPAEVMFGPYGAGETGIYFFSVDKGDLLWTNASDPDSCSDANRLEISTPSEPLMNGCIYDGKPYVWSTERMYEVEFSGAGFVAREIANSKGLFARWAFVVGDLIYYLSRDGIYASQGPGVPQKVTGELEPLFPHNNIAGITTNSISPPDYAQPDSIFLEYGEGLLYLDYLTSGGVAKTTVYHTRRTEWQAEDVYTPTIARHFTEHGKDVQTMVLGSANGKLYQFSGTIDEATGISCELWLPTENGDDPRSQKQFGEAWLDLDTQGLVGNISAQPFFDNYSSSVTATTFTASTGRSKKTIDLSSGTGRFALDAGLKITFTTESNKAPKLYGWEWACVLHPEDTLKRATDWDDQGSVECKYYQGITIKADTVDVARTVEVRYINEVGVETVGATLVIQHNGESVKDYSFAAPFYAYQVRLVPTDANSWKLYTWKYLSQPAPHVGTTWKTPDSSWGQKGYIIMDTEGRIAHNSTADLILKIYVEGVAIPASGYTIPASGGVYKRDTVPLAAVKGRSLSFEITTTAKARIHIQDCEFYLKSFGDAGDFVKVAPFGGANLVTGAEV